MSAVVALEAQAREVVGTGAARAVRNNQAIPAVLYGPGFKTLSLSLDKKIMEKELLDPAFHTKLFVVKLGGKSYQSIVKDVQYHPVTDRVMHVDLYHISKGATIHLAVPVHFINEDACPGLKRGGVLNVIMHDLELTVAASNIPDQIEVDLAGLNMGDTIHLKDISLPEGSTPTYPDRDYTIATIVAPSSVKSAGEGDSSEGDEEAAAK